MTKVVHCKKDKYDIYIVRPSIFGNPFSYKDGTKAKFKVGDREEAISKFHDWVLTQPNILDRIKELKGKILGCWCKPLPCHGDILAKLADELLV